MYKETVRKEVNKVALIKKSLKKYKPCFTIDARLSLNKFLDSLEGRHIYWGLNVSPNLSKYLRLEDWIKLDSGDWSDLLSSQPQFSDKCDFDLLDGWDWSDLLSSQPQFSDKCDFDLLDFYDWSCLLREQPQLEKYRTV